MLFVSAHPRQGATEVMFSPPNAGSMGILGLEQKNEMLSETNIGRQSSFHCLCFRELFRSLGAV